MNLVLFLLHRAMSASKEPFANSTRLSIVALIISAISCYFSIQAYKHTAREYAAERREECVLLITQALQESDSYASDADIYIQSYKAMCSDFETYRSEMASYANEAIGADRRDLQQQMAELAKTSSRMATTLAQDAAARKSFDDLKAKLKEQMDALESDTILGNPDPAWWLTKRRLLTALQQDVRKQHQTLLRESAKFQQEKTVFLTQKAWNESLLKFHNTLFFWRDRKKPQTPSAE